MGEALAELPPSANRGVVTAVTRTNLVPEGSLFGCGVDWLTCSFASQVAAELVTLSELAEEGSKRPGFARSERRTMMGGEGWRRWEPHQASRRWASDYESWEWSGPSAGWPASWLRGRDAKPSRVDVAFDFEVPADVLSDTVADRFESWASRHFTTGIAGQSGVNTRYVGAVSSARRLRVYRKDLRDVGWAAQFGPILRVELVLKEEFAEDWWAAWCLSEEGALRGAAHHVFELTGFEVLADSQAVPALRRPSGSWELADKLFWMFRQYGAILDAAFESGVDLVSIAAERQRGAGRMSTWRRSELAKSIDAVGPEAVESALRTMLGLA